VKATSNDVVVDALWQALRPVLTRFADRVGRDISPLIVDIRRVTSETFPMTAYASFLKDRQGDGLAVTVSVRGDENVLVIESDICMDSGTILAEGPSVTLSLLKDSGKVDGLVDHWLKSFDVFLLDNEREVVAAAQSLD